MWGRRRLPSNSRINDRTPSVRAAHARVLFIQYDGGTRPRVNDGRYCVGLGINNLVRGYKKLLAASACRRRGVTCRPFVCIRIASEKLSAGRIDGLTTAGL
jgi:hypothetical protein